MELTQCPYDSTPIEAEGPLGRLDAAHVPVLLGGVGMARCLAAPGRSEPDREAIRNAATPPPARTETDSSRSQLTDALGYSPV